MREKINKRGELLGDETFGNMLAWVTIIIVVGAVFLIVSNFRTAKETEKAQASLEEINRKISEINLNPSSVSVSVLIPNPLNWNLVSYQKTQTRPPQCSTGTDCLCICPRPGLKAQIEVCSKNGACINVENLNSFEPMLIDSNKLNYISIKKIEGEILIEEKTSS
jgi:hypothetical protein